LDKDKAHEILPNRQIARESSPIPSLIIDNCRPVELSLEEIEMKENKLEKPQTCPEKSQARQP